MDLTNRFKQKITANQRQIGLFLGTGSYYVSEVVATAGFDWLLIDAEHGPNDIHSILQQLQVLSAYDANVVVRLPDHNVSTIKRVLDIGAQTLMIPMVESAEQAEILVKSIHYPPNGIRGVGTAMARAARWNDIQDYFAHADSQICLIAQIESTTGIQNLPDILKIEGIDAIFIGPSDLAASMGYLGNPAHPKVKLAVAEAINAVTKAGKAVGVFSADVEVAKTYEKMGASFMLVGVDVLLLRQSVQQLAQKFNDKTISDSSSY